MAQRSEVTGDPATKKLYHSKLTIKDTRNAFADAQRQAETIVDPHGSDIATAEFDEFLLMMQAQANKVNPGAYPPLERAAPAPAAPAHAAPPTQQEPRALPARTGCARARGRGRRQ